MSKKVGDLCVSVGGYTDKSGIKKKLWRNIGVALEDETGNVTLKFELLPPMTIDKKGYPVAWVKIFISEEKHKNSTSSSHYENKANRYQKDDRPEELSKVEEVPPF